MTGRSMRALAAGMAALCLLLLLQGHRRGSRHDPRSGVLYPESWRGPW